MLGVSHAHNFTADPSTVFEYGYRAYGGLARFTFCLPQEIKGAHSLPVIEMWEKYFPPNHSRYPPIEEKEFLAGSRIAVAPEKVSSFYLRNEFGKDARKFLEELTSTVLSTVADWSDVGQELSCLCPEIVIGGMTMPLIVCLPIFWMACFSWVGFAARLWRPVRLNISLSCATKDNWSA